tara:strand:+ start:18085 stop:19023 length:939 start_codon:yes stop_codon:yes gene_type:complete
MSISIVTPHYNDFNGLRAIYLTLLEQSHSEWEWVIVDDCSEITAQEVVKNWFTTLNDMRVQVIFNVEKTNASVCRNKGADASIYDCLVFLDSDDIITVDFIANRKLCFHDFTVFSSFAVLEKNNQIIQKKILSENYLDSYLSAVFLWQTSCFLWDKSFFNTIGQFHPDLPRLQDVELAIRALQSSTQFQVITDNPIDFYYKVKPIRERKNFVKPVCEAVAILLNRCLDWEVLNKRQVAMLSGYYFTCVRYLERSQSLDYLALVQSNLKLFLRKGIISWWLYQSGLWSLKLYALGWLSPQLFIRINRRLFKPL